MNFADTVRGLLRRWYILLAGLLLAAGGAAVVWIQVPPTFERSSSQVLLPGNASLPDRGKNPYLYLGGLTLAADVVVRAVGSESLVQELKRTYPGTEVQVSRDPSTAGPVVLITVTSPSDADAAAVLNMLVARTSAALESLQRAESIPSGERITVVTVAVDNQSTIKVRNRIIFSAATAVGILGLSLVVAAAAEGLSGQRGKRAQGMTKDPEYADPAPPVSEETPVAPTPRGSASAEDDGHVLTLPHGAGTRESLSSLSPDTDHLPPADTGSDRARARRRR